MLEQPLKYDVGPSLRPELPRFNNALLLHRLLDKLPAGAYTCDPTGLITYFNPYAVKLWGRAPALNDPVDRFCGSFKLYATDGSPIAHDQCWMALALRQQKTYDGCEILIERPDGQHLAALAYASPVFDSSGQLLGAVNVLVDITDRRRAEEALKEAARAKDDFLATMSHEIRTPINAIIGYTDLLGLEVIGPLTDGQRAHLARVRAASRHLLSLVGEVLDLSKIEAGRMTIRREPQLVRGTIEAALAVVQPLAAARGIAVVSRAGATPLAYDGDEDRVRQMLINLLSNAVKFSEPGSRVEIACGTTDAPHLPLAPEASSEQWVTIRVCDRGIGIAADQLERIFEPFIQVEAAHTRTRGGPGLGLTISRRLARLMGGDLTVESAIGVGSVFTLWLPASDADLACTAAPGQTGPAAADRSAARGFSAAGHALLTALEEILRGYVERLRTERVGPGTGSLTDGRLAGHAATLLVDIAAALIEIEDGEATLVMLSAGSEIQRVCATEHGRQRGGLGWNETDLVRDYTVLWEETSRHVRRLAADAAASSVFVTIQNHLERARTYSIHGLQSTYC